MASIFVTVGTTAFDGLVSTVTSPEFLSVLESRGCSELTVQYGTSEAIFENHLQAYHGPLNVLGYAYKPSITEDMKKADTIISHGGSGTIVQALRLNKQLIVVANQHLMDNHQTELTTAFEKEGYLACSTTSNLVNTFEEVYTKTFTPFPTSHAHLFAETIDTLMGYPPS